MNVVYEDNHLIAVIKQPGQLTQGDRTGDPALLSEVRAFIKERDHKPGNVFIGLLHRLDRPVGGVVLFAKTSKGASRLSEQIRERTVEKIYEALVEGTPEPRHGTVAQWLVKDPHTHRVRAYPHRVRGGLYAELEYHVLKAGKVSRLVIQPHTGRPHQIRVAAASLGTPIVGDKKYGARTPYHGQIALYATMLTFDHPITDERIEIRVPSPFDTNAGFRS